MVATSSGSSQQDPYPSSLCIPPTSALGATAPLAQHCIPSPGQILAPGKLASAEGMLEEGRVCVQERACAHVREKEAGL